MLVAVGRAPRTQDVGMEKTKIELDRGFVKVNEAQETAEPGVYAIGDIVAGLPQLAHVGGDERHRGRDQDCGAAVSGAAATAFPPALTASRRSGPSD